MFPVFWRSSIPPWAVSASSSLRYLLSAAPFPGGSCRTHQPLCPLYLVILRCHMLNAMWTNEFVASETSWEHLSQRHSFPHTYKAGPWVTWLQNRLLVSQRVSPESSCPGLFGRIPQDETQGTSKVINSVYRQLQICNLITQAPN